MASWKLVDVPDSASEYVGQVLEDSGKVAKTNLTNESSRINEVADTAKGVIIIQILEAAG